MRYVQVFARTVPLFGSGARCMRWLEEHETTGPLVLNAVECHCGMGRKCLRRKDRPIHVSDLRLIKKRETSLCGKSLSVVYTNDGYRTSLMTKLSTKKRAG